MDGCSPRVNSRDTFDQLDGHPWEAVLASLSYWVNKKWTFLKHLENSSSILMFQPSIFIGPNLEFCWLRGPITCGVSTVPTVPTVPQKHDTPGPITWWSIRTAKWEQAHCNRPPRRPDQEAPITSRPVNKCAEMAVSEVYRCIYIYI